MGKFVFRSGSGRVRDAYPGRRHRNRARPSTEALEVRSLLAVAFTSLPFQDVGSFVSGADGNFYEVPIVQSDEIERISVSGVVTRFPLPSTFDTVNQVTAGADGNIWFTETGSIPTVPYNPKNPYTPFTAIGRLTPAGQITEVNLPGPLDPNGSDAATDIEPGPGGDVWFVVEERTSTGADSPGLIGRITPTGQVSEFDAVGVGGPNSNTLDQTQIAGGSDGNLYYTEPDSHAIGRLSPSGVVTQTAVPNGETALSITRGPDGNIWFTEQSGVGRITSNGAVTLYASPNPLDSPGEITAGPDGNVWLTNGEGVSRVTPSGVVTDYYTPEANSFPSWIGIGPQHALLFTAEGSPYLNVIKTSTTATAPVVIATAETSPQYEELATKVAHFTSTDPLATLADYQAVVHWDNNPNESVQGIIKPDVEGGYDAFVSVPENTPTTDPIGPHEATVSIFDTRAGGPAMTTVNSTLTLTPGDPSPATGFFPGVTFNQSGLGTASATLQVYGAQTADYETATFNFGDGTAPVTAKVTSQVNTYHPEPGFTYQATNFTATETHRYANPGGYTVTVTFRDKNGNLLANDALIFFDE